MVIKTIKRTARSWCQTQTLYIWWEVIVVWLSGWVEQSAFSWLINRWWTWPMTAVTWEILTPCSVFVMTKHADITENVPVPVPCKDTTVCVIKMDCLHSPAKVSHWILPIGAAQLLILERLQSCVPCYWTGVLAIPATNYMHMLGILIDDIRDSLQTYDRLTWLNQMSESISGIICTVIWAPMTSVPLRFLCTGTDTQFRSFSIISIIVYGIIIYKDGITKPIACFPDGPWFTP